MTKKKKSRNRTVKNEERSFLVLKLRGGRPSMMILDKKKYKRNRDKNIDRSEE